MIFRRHLRAPLFILGCFLVFHGYSAPAPGREATSLMPSSGVLLLQNGEVIEGRISRVGDWYYIVLEGGEIRIRPDRVEDHCDSLDEGYLRKRERTRPGDVHDRVRLAQWCIRHGLVERAGEELDAAAAIDARHPMLPLLKRQISVAATAPVERTETTATAGPDRPRGPTTDELDRLVRSLPPDAVEMFTRTIQPLLVNRCSTGACHGPGCTSRLRLNRFRAGAAPGRRTTQKNLHATMQFIDPSDPAGSELLRLPSRKHGNTAAMFTENDRQYRILEGWIHSIADPETAQEDPDSPPERVRSPHRPPIHAMPQPRRPGPDAFAEETHTRIQDPGVANEGEDRDNDANDPVRFAPRDPFDPEIFNRMAK